MALLMQWWFMSLEIYVVGDNINIKTPSHTRRKHSTFYFPSKIKSSHVTQKSSLDIKIFQ